MPVFQLPPNDSGQSSSNGNRRKPRYSAGNEPFAHIYKSQRWAEFRATIIKERGYRCEDPAHNSGSRDRVARLDLDHIKELQDGGAPFDRANVMLRCRSCHVKKTKAESTERDRVAFWERRARLQRGGGD